MKKVVWREKSGKGKRITRKTAVIGERLRFFGDNDTARQREKERNRPVSGKESKKAKNCLAIALLFGWISYKIHWLFRSFVIDFFQRK